MSKETSIVVSIDHHSVEKGIKKFKRLCESAGILKEYKKRKEYKKPCVKRKEKVEAATKRKIKERFKRDRSPSV